VISNRYAKCRVHLLFFSENFVSRHSFPRGQSIPRQTARRRLPFTNSRAKQPRSTDCELRSSSFPFAVPIAVPISRSVSSRSPYQFVVCWPSVCRRIGSPLGSSIDLHQVAAISQAGEGGRAMLLQSREVVAARRETARREEKSLRGGTENPVISIYIAGLLWHICQVSPSKCIAM